MKSVPSMPSVGIGKSEVTTLNFCFKLKFSTLRFESIVPSDDTMCSLTPVILQMLSEFIKSGSLIKFSLSMDISAPVSSRNVKGFWVKLVFNNM